MRLTLPGGFRIILALEALFVGVLFLAMPNAIQGNDWFGYSRGRFLQIFVFLVTGIGLLAGRAYFSRLLDSLKRAVRRGWLAALVASLLVVTSLLCLAWLAAPANRLPPLVLAYRLLFWPVVFWLGLVAGQTFLWILYIRAADSARRITWPLMGLVGLVWAGLRLGNALHVLEPWVTRDSAEYLGQAMWSQFFSPAIFWGGPRPFVLPMVATALRQQPVAIAWFHTILALLAWLILAWAVTRRLKNLWLQPLAFAVILGFSLIRNIMVWDWAILAESISLSLLVLLAAGWLWLLEKVTLPRALGVLLLSFLWAFTRDINAWMVLLTGLTVLIFCGWPRPSVHWLAMAGLLVGVFLLNHSSVDARPSPRWTLPFLHAFTRDLLPNPQARAFLIQRGMPVPRGLLEWSGALPDWEAYQSVPYAEFRTWVADSGRGVFARYLLVHWQKTLFQPLFAEPGFPLPPTETFGTTYNYKSIYPQTVEKLFGLGWPAWLTGALGVSLAVLGYAELHRSPAGYGWGALWLLLAAYPQAFLAWHGDGIDKPRHLLPPDIQLRLGLLLLLIFLADRWLARHISAAPTMAMKGQRNPEGHSI